MNRHAVQLIARGAINRMGDVYKRRLIWLKIVALSHPIPFTKRCSMSLTILERPRQPYGRWSLRWGKKLELT